MNHPTLLNVKKANKKRIKHNNMTLSNFLQNYDLPHSIVLLEGKRNVKEEDKEKLTALGELLATRTQNMLFRSGNAEGSDQYFSDGVTKVDHTRLQVITPYAGHRKKTNQAYDTINLDELDLAADSPVIYHSKSNKKTEKLIDKYVAGARDRFSIKAAYIIRDTIKVLGTNEILPATFGIFYDDLEDPMAGGTGHTMDVCKQHNIPMVDQSAWFKWLEDKQL